MGEVIVPRTYKKTIVDANSQLQEKTFSVSGRKIPLSRIREMELQRLEKMGLIRAHDDNFYETLTDEQIKARLQELGELEEDQTVEE